MTIIISNILNMRKNKQKQNNKIVVNYLLKSNLSLKKLTSVINVKELSRVLFELH